MREKRSKMMSKVPCHAELLDRNVAGDIHLLVTLQYKPADDGLERAIRAAPAVVVKLVLHVVVVVVATRGGPDAAERQLMSVIGLAGESWGWRERERRRRGGRERI